MIVRDRLTKQAVAELSDELLARRTLKPQWEVVTPHQHLIELNIKGSNARQYKEHVNKAALDGYESRVQANLDLGMTRSDAQGVVDAEDRNL